MSEITLESLAAKLEELNKEVTSLKEENEKLRQEDKVNQAIKNHSQILQGHAMVPQAVWDQIAMETPKDSTKNTKRRLSLTGTTSVDDIKRMNKVS